MSSDRDWMHYRVNSAGGISTEYRTGVDTFVEFAAERVKDLNGKIRCPCLKCKNLKWMMPDELKMHLYRWGIIESYKIWDLHGESERSRVEVTTNQNIRTDEEMYDALDMLRDIAQPSFGNDEEPNDEASYFYKMVEDASVQIYPGNTKYTKLSFVTKLLHFKNKHGCSQKGFDELLQLIGDVLPCDHTLPDKYIKVRNMLKGLNLGYEKIDACENDCMLFYGDDANKVWCDICSESRFKDRQDTTKKLIPKKILRYFPITPRLQRLFMSAHTAQYMRWHKNRTVIDGQLTHPADGDEWKQFDIRYPSFAREVRNIRLGLATDGFNPFSNAYAKTYTVWPVIVVVYNLPPSMFMKDPYMFMPLLIPGEKSPTKDINIYLRPLIDELKMLWDTGVQTFDRSSNTNFLMKAALMWTISDFPAYGMISGWSTHGKLSCPVCLGEVRGFQLKNRGKCSFYGTSRIFLELNDPLRKNVKFGAKETRSVTTQYSGSLVKQSLQQLQFPPPGKSIKQKAAGFGVMHNWTHLSAFFMLPYWETLRLRHNIDVMHTEKNFFDNVFYTVLDDTTKSKDNIKARHDCQLLNVRPDLWITFDVMPTAPYALSREQVYKLCKWVKQMKLPDGYCSNIARCSNIEQGKFQGMKSHDCHVFMQKLMPIVARDLLPKSIGDVLIEVSNFFQDICSTVLIHTDLVKMEKNIAKTLSLLEIIFPPSFFDSMEHLPIHLPTECKLGGPVQYRWMYPFERYMRLLKMKVKNKARPEGSMTERYVEEELVNFCSLYFESNVETVHNRLRRNEAPQHSYVPNLLAVFMYPTQSIGRRYSRSLSAHDHDILTYYVLINMPEVAEYLSEFEDLVYEKYPNIDDASFEVYCKKEFRTWFEKRVKDDDELCSKFIDIIRGPMNRYGSYIGCICNHYIFQCANTSELTSSNSGVLVKGTCSSDSLDNYYGRLEEVLELTYHNGHNIMVFKCHWFDTTRNVKVDKHRMTTVNVKSKLASDDVFVLASQAIQVYYAPNVSNPSSPWYTVVTTKSRLLDEEASYNDDVFQEEMSKTSLSHVDATIIHEPSHFFIDLSFFENVSTSIDDNDEKIDDEETSVDENSEDDNDEEIE